MTFNLLISLVAGPVAHLGERLVRNEKVAGSIPVRSTKWSPDAHPPDTRIERAICVKVCYY